MSAMVSSSSSGIAADISDDVNRLRTEIRNLLRASGSVDPRADLIRKDLAALQARAERLTIEPRGGSLRAASASPVSATAIWLARDRVVDALDYLEIVLEMIKLRRAGDVRAVSDVPGVDLRPDPARARTGAELVDVLRKYREWAGDPSYRVFSVWNTGKPAAPTICVALNGVALPKLDMVLAIVAGCGGGEEDEQRFASAWRAIRTGAVAADEPEEGSLNSGAAALRAYYPAFRGRAHVHLVDAPD